MKLTKRLVKQEVQEKLAASLSCQLMVPVKLRKQHEAKDEIEYAVVAEEGAGVFKRGTFKRIAVVTVKLDGGVK